MSGALDGGYLSAALFRWFSETQLQNKRTLDCILKEKGEDTGAWYPSEHGFGWWSSNFMQY
jgi:hypothetical protein